MTDSNNQELHRLLAELHRELGRSPQLDPESRELLATVSSDITTTLAGKGQHASRLEALAVKFETDHPALAEAVRDVIDALGKAGV